MVRRHTTSVPYVRSSSLMRRLRPPSPMRRSLLSRSLPRTASIPRISSTTALRLMQPAPRTVTKRASSARFATLGSILKRRSRSTTTPSAQRITTVRPVPLGSFRIAARQTAPNGATTGTSVRSVMQRRSKTTLLTSAVTRPRRSPAAFPPAAPMVSPTVSTAPFAAMSIILSLSRK